MIRMFLLGALALSPQQQTDTTFAVRAGGTLEVDAWGGSVQVRTWDQARMRIQARHPANTRLEIDVDGGVVQVEAASRRGIARDVAMEITVPRRFGVQVEGVQLEADVAGTEGDVAIETVQGSITIRDVTGRIAAGSASGRIAVSGSRGELHVEAVNDGVTITGHEGEVSVESVNGPVVLTGVRSSRVGVETTNGEIRFDGELRAGGEYRLESHNGDLTVALPAGASATVSIDTWNGEIDADFPLQIRGTRNRQSVTFEVGSGGGARIELESFGGSIRLRRSNAAAR